MHGSTAKAAFGWQLPLHNAQGSAARQRSEAAMRDAHRIPSVKPRRQLHARCPANVRACQLAAAPPPAAALPPQGRALPRQSGRVAPRGLGPTQVLRAHMRAQAWAHHAAVPYRLASLHA
eukprot:scaffold312504_cov31-Tisochrysis_lutea.AAC.2